MNGKKSNWIRDGWDAQLRIGLVVPHADIGPESEFGAMSGETISIHAARLKFSAMRAGGVMDEKIPHAPVEVFTQAPYLDNIARDLAESPLDVIVLAFTSSAYKHGPLGERALINRIRRSTRGIPVVSTCYAAELAMNALSVKNVAIVNPSWFDSSMSNLAKEYFENLGFKVVHHSPAEISGGPQGISPDNLYLWVNKVAADWRPDAIFIAGNGQRAVGIINRVEEETGIPILTANQVSLWASLKVSKSNVDISRYGCIFKY